MPPNQKKKASGYSLSPGEVERLRYVDMMRRLRPTVPGPVVTQATLLDGLVAYWKLDEASGNAADATGRGNDLTNTGTLAYAAGKINNGANPDGGARKLSFANNADNTLNNSSFTISLWVKLAAKPAALQYIWSKSGSYNLYWDNTTDRFIILTRHGGVNKFLPAPTFGAPTIGDINHIIWGWDAALGKTFIRVNMGAIDYYPTALAALDDAAATVYLCANNNSSPLNGLLDEVGLWKRVLNEAEQARLYNGGLGLQHPFDNPWYLAFEGDSQSTRGTPTTDYPHYVLSDLGGGQANTIHAVSGSRVNVEVTNRAATVNAAAPAGKSRRILLVWAGINDMYTNSVVTAVQVYDGLEAYCNTMAASGLWYKIVVFTLTPSTVAGTDPTYETRRLAFNTNLRVGYTAFADLLIDIGGDAIYGDVANCGNTSYFDDGIHLSATGRRHVATMVTTLLRSIA